MEPENVQFEDRSQVVPASEAEAVAAAQREDDERARRLGLKRTARPGQDVAKDWTGRIGSPDAHDKAARLLQEEAAGRKRRSAARRRAVAGIIGTVLVLALVVGAGAATADWLGLVHLGLFPPRPQPDSAANAPAPATNAAPIAAPVPDAASAPLADRPTPDPRAVRKATDSLAARQRGVDTVQGDLDERRQRIIASLVRLYGFPPRPRDAVPPRSAWRMPSALLELEQVRARQPAGQDYGAWMIRVQNLDAEVSNLNGALRRDRDMEMSLEARLIKATKDRDAAKARLDELR